MGATAGLLDRVPTLDDRSLRRLLDVALVVALVPVVVAIAWSLTHTWHASADRAFLELELRDVGGPHTPLVGIHSRFEWHQPGPWYEYLLAVPYRLLGSRSTGALVGATLVHGAALVGTVLVVRRRGGPGLGLLVLAALAVLVHSGGGVLLRDSWHPWPPTLLVLLLLVVAWSVLEGDVAVLPVGVAGASLGVQMHVGYAPVLGALALTTAVGLVLAARGGALAPGVLRRALVRSAAVAAVAWAPPLVDQLTGTGNLGALLSFFAEGEGRTIGAGDAADLVARQLAPGAPWVTGQEPLHPFVGGILPGPRHDLVVALLAGGVAAVLAWRRDDRSALRLLGVAAVGLLASWWALQRLTGIPYPYVTRWLWPVAAGWAVATAWGWWRAVPADRRGPLRTLAAPVLVLVVVTTSAATAVDAATGPPADPRDARALAVVVPQLAGALPDGVDLVAIRGSGPFAIAPMTGVGLALERSGVSVRAPGLLERTWGSRRTTGDRPTQGTVTVVTGAQVDRFVERRDAAVELARYESRWAEPERAAVAALGEHLDAVGHPELLADAIAGRYDDLVALDEESARLARLLDDVRVAAGADGRWPQLAVFWEPAG